MIFLRACVSLESTTDSSLSSLGYSYYHDKSSMMRLSELYITSITPLIKINFGMLISLLDIFNFIILFQQRHTFDNLVVIQKLFSGVFLTSYDLNDLSSMFEEESLAILLKLYFLWIVSKWDFIELQPSSLDNPLVTEVFSNKLIKIFLQLFESPRKMLSKGFEVLQLILLVFLLSFSFLPFTKVFHRITYGAMNDNGKVEYDIEAWNIDYSSSCIVSKFHVIIYIRIQEERESYVT